jgi:hypothetical protein
MSSGNKHFSSQQRFWQHANQALLGADTSDLCRCIEQDNKNNRNVPPSGLLYDVKPTDALTFLGMTIVLVLVTLLACYISARRSEASHDSVCSRSPLSDDVRRGIAPTVPRNPRPRQWLPSESSD